MPRAVQYKKGSIVYFSGDRSKSVYILKSGRIALVSLDLHDGQEVTEYVKEGEFFGVKDALGKYPRDETAMVINESVVVQFTPEEFDDFTNNKPDLIMKMLKIYSRQLRILHGDVQNLLTTTNVRFPEEGMIQAADYYFSNKKNQQALYFYQTYQKKFPGGAYTNLAEERISALKSSPGGGGSPVRSVPAATAGKPSAATASQVLGLAERLYNAGDYQQAFSLYKDAFDSGEKEIAVAAEFRLGCCLFHLGKFNDSVQFMSNLLRNSPKHPRIGEALYYLGACYNALHVVDKARAFFLKAQGYLTPDSDYFTKTSDYLKELGKGNP